MKNKLLKFVLYPLFFLTCLVFFVIQGFPIQVIADIAIREARQKMGLKLTINNLSTLFPNGVEATGVRLVKESEEETLPVSLRLDEVSARISLFSLLAGHKNISFSSELLAGKVEGEFNTEGENWKLKAQLAAINLGKINFWPDIIGQELTGKVSGTVELNVNPKDIKATRGSIVLDVVQGQIGKGKAYGVNIPWVSLGKTQTSLEIQKGKAEIKSFKVTSDDLDASLDGYFLLQQKLANLSAHCRLRFKPSEEKLAEIRNQIPEELRGLLDNELNKAKGKDGFYRYSIFGRLFGGKPQVRPLKQ